MILEKGKFRGFILKTGILLLITIIFLVPQNVNANSFGIGVSLGTFKCTKGTFTEIGRCY
jgi:hypothetical protein